MTYTTEQLEKMLSDATPGPWETRGAKVGGDKAICTSKREILAEAYADIRCANEMAFDECAANAALIAAAPTITAELIAARRRLEAVQGLVDALQACVASIEHADMSDGVCCCGDDMETHSEPMSCGHSPVDAGEYHAYRAIQSARAAIAALEATQ